MNLQRAIAKYLADRIAGLHPFKDDIAWNSAGNPYPYLLMTEISSSRRGLGSGVWDGITDDSHPVKLIKQRTVLRLTIRAISSKTESGNQIASTIGDKITDLFFKLCQYGGLDIQIPGTDPVETVHIERSIYQGSIDLQVDESGEPFIYQKALTFAFVTHRIHENHPVGIFSEIQINKE